MADVPVLVPVDVLDDVMDVVKVVVAVEVADVDVRAVDVGVVVMLEVAEAEAVLRAVTLGVVLADEDNVVVSEMLFVDVRVEDTETVALDETEVVAVDVYVEVAVTVCVEDAVEVPVLVAVVTLHDEKAPVTNAFTTCCPTHNKTNTWCANTCVSETCSVSFCAVYFSPDSPLPPISPCYTDQNMPTRARHTQDLYVTYINGFCSAADSNTSLPRGTAGRGLTSFSESMAVWHGWTAEKR